MIFVILLLRIPPLTKSKIYFLLKALNYCLYIYIYSNLYCHEMQHNCAAVEETDTIRYSVLFFT